MGSGVFITKAIKEKGSENFKKDILFVFDNFDEMNNKEIELVNLEFINRDDVYNLQIGGQNKRNKSYLIEHIIRFSKGCNMKTILKNKEWNVHYIKYLNTTTEEGEVCSCKHKPIYELIYIINKNPIKIDNELVYPILLVGNCCINRILPELSKTTIFSSIKNVLKDDNKSFNKDTITHFSYLFQPHEIKFLKQIGRKRKLSEKQQRWKGFLYEKIINDFTCKENIVKTPTTKTKLEKAREHIINGAKKLKFFNDNTPKYFIRLYGDIIKNDEIRLLINQNLNNLLTKVVVK